jgi:hypothetical protein
MQTVHKAAMAEKTGMFATEMTGTTAGAVAKIEATAGTVMSAVEIALSGRSAIREDDGKTTNTGAIHRNPCLPPLRRNCLPAKGS